MSEIEKLYENAGIAPTYYDACTVEDNYWQNEELANKYGTFDMYMNAKCGKQEDCTTLCRCAYTREEYPPFTSEKQAELIKWLIQRVDHLELWFFGGKEGTFDFDLGKFNAKGVTFEETLAKLVNTLWQSLTDAEKEQIRDILKG